MKISPTIEVVVYVYDYVYERGTMENSVGMPAAASPKTFRLKTDVDAELEGV